MAIDSIMNEEKCANLRPVVSGVFHPLISVPVLGGLLQPVDGLPWNHFGGSVVVPALRLVHRLDQLVHRGTTEEPAQIKPQLYIYLR